MKTYDVLVIGAGSGLDVANAAASRGMDVALVEKGPLGGTCLNRGCIPSKMLIHRADLVREIQDSEKFGIKSEVKDIEFRKIVEEVNKDVEEDAEGIEEGIRSYGGIDLYKEEARFVEERTVEAGGEKLQGDKVIVAGGARPFVPPIDGIEDVGYLTSREALKLKELPERLLIVGGGYIAAELGHFFGTMGSEVTVVTDGEGLLTREDPDISKKFTELFGGRYDVFTDLRAESVVEESGEITVTAGSGSEETEVTGDELLMATGRRPNTDILEVEKGGIETDGKGFVETNEYLETTAENTWALGDIVNSPMFKHTANMEAEYVFRNAFTDHRHKVDYTAAPHAIFTEPQIAGVGKTEQELEEEGVEYVTGKHRYEETGMGSAMKEERGFVKAMVDTRGKILGCHILGPQASVLIHEVVVAMKAGSGTVHDIGNSVHIHPALSEVVQRAFDSVGKR